MKKSKLLTALMALIMSSTILVNAAPELENTGEKSELNADEVEYNMDTGVATATGNVVLKHGSGVATGLKAMYNTNTEAAYLTGNVIVVRDNLRLTCNSLNSDGYGHMQADGNVYAEQKIAPSADMPQGDLRTFKGEHVDYYPDDRQHIVIPTGGVLTSTQEGVFTADHMEGWLDDQYYIGTGNAHIVSKPRDLEAGGDQIEYYANENGKAILSGNAWAFQDNNTLRGNRLTVYLADKPKENSTPNPFADKKKKPQDKPEAAVVQPFTNSTDVDRINRSLNSDAGQTAE